MRPVVQKISHVSFTLGPVIVVEIAGIESEIICRLTYEL